MTERQERHETDEERAESEAREEAERLRARARELAEMPTDRLLKEASDDELRAETARLAKRTRDEETRLLPRETLRSTGHARINAVREQVTIAAAGAVTHAARGAAIQGGPTLEDLLHAHALAGLASATDSFWRQLHDAVDAPAPKGQPEVFADRDYRAEAQAATREREARRSAISDELDARQFEREVARRPGMADRVAALLHKGKP